MVKWLFVFIHFILFEFFPSVCLCLSIIVVILFYEKTARVPRRFYSTCKLLTKILSTFIFRLFALFIIHAESRLSKERKKKESPSIDQRQTR